MSEDLVQRLRDCTYHIWYQPLPGEEDPTSFFTQHGLSLEPRFIIPANADTLPGEIAQRIIKRVAEGQACILIPGQRFDLWGTRHGRGGGWYDRLLALLPASWMRIGVTSVNNISTLPLIRHPWDQPMDWLLFQEHGSWHVHQNPRRALPNRQHP